MPMLRSTAQCVLGGSPEPGEQDLCPGFTPLPLMTLGKSLPFLGLTLPIRKTRELLDRLISKSQVLLITLGVTR